MGPSDKEKNGRAATSPTDVAPGVIRIGARILVIEDDETVRDLMRTILERAGHRVIAARDGATALLAVETASQRPDAAVADIVLPGPNGIAVVRQLRERWPELPAIFVTGHASELPDTGDDLLLEKPFPPVALTAAVAAALGIVPVVDRPARRGAPSPGRETGSPGRRRARPRALAKPPGHDRVEETDHDPMVRADGI